MLVPVAVLTLAGGIIIGFGLTVLAIIVLVVFIVLVVSVASQFGDALSHATAINPSSAGEVSSACRGTTRTVYPKLPERASGTVPA